MRKFTNKLRSDIKSSSVEKIRKTKNEFIFKLDGWDIEQVPMHLRKGF